jgi:hypothetical protein
VLLVDEFESEELAGEDEREEDDPWTPSCDRRLTRGDAASPPSKDVVVSRRLRGLLYVDTFSTPAVLPLSCRPLETSRLQPSKRFNDGGVPQGVQFKVFVEASSNAILLGDALLRAKDSCLLVLDLSLGLETLG